MNGLVVLIMLFFSILATVLILIMAGIAMLLLLFVFFVVAIIVGAKQQSIFKGLKIFLLSSSMLIITPLTCIIFRTYNSQLLNLSQDQNLLVGIILGLIISIIFGMVSYKTFEKMAQFIYKKLSKRKLQ